MGLPVVIVGGGIIGASIAWRLAQRGYAVTIKEARTLGSEASWAGAGMLAPGGELTERAAWRDLALRSHAMYGDYVRELEAESGVPIDLRTCGAIELAASEEEWRELRDRADRQREFGVASSELEAVDIARMVPGLRLRPFTRGLWYAGDALVDPRHVMAALRVALGKHGVRIVEGERVTRIEANEPTVLAAGAWASEIETPGAPIPRAYPIRGHLTAYQLPPGRVGPLVRHHHTYLLQRSNGVFIAGTSEELAGFNRDIDPVVESGIRRRAAEWLPELAGLPSTTWTGFRPAAEGLDPVIGPLNGAPLWLAYGHYRNGILMAPGTAEVVADSVAAHLG